MSKMEAYIVTGSGSGIGLAITRLLVSRGHAVYGLGRDPAKLERLSSELPKRQFGFSAVDLTNAAATHATVATIRQWLNSNDLSLMGLVNNAGVFDRIAFNLTSDAIWERQFHNNLLSAVRLTRELYPDLKKNRRSSVLNISSTLGRRPISHTTAYSALKAAMINWTQCLALEWAGDDIRVNCICPGIVDTPIHDFHSKGAEDPGRAQAHQAQPLKRMGQPIDIAAAAAFLLSQDSQWTTGSVLAVDGGIGL